MDKGKKTGQSRTVNRCNQIYMNLKDIIRENMLRFLPAKSLLRCTAVCKDWQLQISKPFFVHSQTHNFRSVSGLFYQPPGGTPSFLSLDPAAYGVPDPQLKFLPEPVDLMASAYGLLCCRGHTEDKAYYICNPVNGHWKKLPKPNVDHGSSPSIVLAFEPTVLSFVADYKLICAFPSADFDDAYEFEIYSSVNDSWTNSSELCFAERSRVLQKSGVYVNGVAYWSSDHFDVIALDLKKDRLAVIPCYEMPAFFVLGVADGKLYAAYFLEEKIRVQVLSNMYANTMHMGRHCSIWQTKESFSPCDPISDGTDPEGVTLAAGRKLVVFRIGQEIFSHDLRTKETKILTTEATDNCVYVPYVNSLVCLM